MATVRAGRGFNVSSFVGYRKAVGHLRTNTFLVVIPWPLGMKNNTTLLQSERNMELACDSINFPLTGVVTYQVQRYSYGAVEFNPTINKFSPLQCTFICDQEAQVQKFFHEWIKTTVNYDFYDSIIDPAGTTIGGTSAMPYEIGYREEYSVDIFLHIYDQYGTEQRIIRFREAYPTDVGDVSLSWNRKDEYMKIPVTFTFIDWSDMQIHGQSG
jgi:hypothetical protein